MTTVATTVAPPPLSFDNGCFRSIGRKRSTTCVKIEYILSQLSEDELETAARSSYEYVRTAQHHRRIHYAEDLVRIILESKNGDAERALAKIQTTLEFRDKHGMDDLIQAFDNPHKIATETAKRLKKQLSTNKFYVRGFDKEGRATLYFIVRNVVDHDLESALYSIERAIASTKSIDGTINCVVDFSEFNLGNAPPLEIGKEFLTTLRTMYAGQIHKIFLVNTPFSFHFLWKIFSPFVGTQTRDKISMASPSNLYDADELPSWLGGTSNRPFDIDEYLYRLPFDAAFGSA